MGESVKVARERVRAPHKAYEGPVFEKEIRCNCGKLLARRTKCGKIMVWCKQCRKEVELEVEPDEPVGKNVRKTT